MSGVPARVLWWDDLDAPATTRGRARLDDVDGDADVVIIGAGFTGLWTAYRLLEQARDLRVLVLEAHHVGFGASGRNGGWCTPEIPLSLDAVDARHGAGAAHRWRTALVDVVDDIRETLRHEDVDARWADGGWLQLARNDAQRARVQHTVAMYRRHGFDEHALRWMEPDEVAPLTGATSVRGASFSAETSALQPARLVQGLARAVRHRGGVIVEQCHVDAVGPHAVTVAGRTISARWIVRATEGYSARTRLDRRRVVPVYSMMIATEPLDDDTWDRIGLSGRTVFNDARHTVIYGQRTADGRLAFGGRGAPYHVGSRISPAFDTHEPTRRHLRNTLIELFPCLADVKVTHHWGGPLGIPRDWHPGVGLDAAQGWAWARGFVGEGVAAAALAGHTLADLIVQRSSARTELAWVGHASRRWEPEPLRWLGINAMVRIAQYVDRRERRQSKPPRVATALLNRVSGH